MITRKILMSYILLSVVRANLSDTDEEFKKFVEEVEVVINASSTYKLPINNNAFFANTTDNIDPIDYGTYDFIIVGGGTAGGVLGARLTETNLTVLIVEAGKTEGAISAVLNLNTYAYYSDYNWGYFTTSQTQSCLGGREQKCFFPRGKVLGGCSSINAGLYVRGNKKDYDIWSDLGNSGWSYEEVLPYFKKSERAEFKIDIDAAFHAFDGVQAINASEDTPNITQLFLDAYGDIGGNRSDYNGWSQHSYSRFQNYLDFNTRSSTTHSFIRPVENRTNLHIVLEALVTKIAISNKTATGIEFVKNGTKYRASAGKEVIISAGAINSPQVLILSGIGPASHLKELEIEVIADLPVGQNLQDHTVFPALHFRSEQIMYNLTLQESLELWRQAKRPLVAGTGGQPISFWSTRDSQDVPEIEIYPITSSQSIGNLFQLNDEYSEAYQIVNPLTDLLIVVVLLHPISAGNVTLQSNDPRDFPLINTNYFESEDDLEAMYKGIQIALSLNDTEAFKAFGASIYTIDLPSCNDHEKYSRDWWYCGLKALSFTLFHPMSTNRMGNSTIDSVVDSDLKVHGVNRLRIVDASVIPATTSGHLNAPVVMIAEKIADVLKSEYAL